MPDHSALSKGLPGRIHVAATDIAHQMENSIKTYFRTSGMTAVEQRLKNAGIILPNENTPAGEYLTFKKAGNLIFVSGQTCRVEGKMAFAGRLGKEFTLEQAQEAAKICAVNILVQVRHACEGNLDRVKNCIKLNVYVNAVPEYADHAKVSNGASSVMITAFGEAGRHVRTTIGCGSLPGQSLIEADGIFEVI